MNEKQIIERNKELVGKYPFLLPRNVFSDKLREDYNYEYTWYDDLEKGWQIGLGKFLLEDLKEVLVKTNNLDEFRFYQIKEKFGTLRLYTNGMPEEVQNVLDKYEFISQYICVHCGSPHACIVDNYGWYQPLCRDCWDKDNEWRKEKGRKIISYEDAVGEELYEMPDSYTVTRRYSNGEKEKIIYDISKTTKKIREAYKIRKEKQC